MPGVPGSGGPPPKRSNQRRRRNKPAGGEIDKAPGADEVTVPDANPKWHPVARQWYESLAASGQSAFYEASDWTTAYTVAESLSRDLKPKVVAVNPVTGDPIRAEAPLNGAALAAFLKACTVLLVTEGDRRRSRLELERPKGDVNGDIADVSWLDEARRSS